MCDWSAGVSMVEHSVLNAYTDLIRTSQSYIYIENQFFITTCDQTKDDKVRNMIGAEIVDRIVKAHRLYCLKISSFILFIFVLILL